MQGSQHQTNWLQLTRFCRRLSNSFALRHSLFDYPVGDGENTGRDVELERLGSAQVDDEFEFSGLLHRKIARLIAFEDAGDVNAGLAGHLQPVRSIAHQTARGWKFGPVINRRNSVTGCQRFMT